MHRREWKKGQGDSIVKKKKTVVILKVEVTEGWMKD